MLMLITRIIVSDYYHHWKKWKLSDKKFMFGYFNNDYRDHHKMMVIGRLTHTHHYYMKRRKNVLNVCHHHHYRLWWYLVLGFGRHYIALCLCYVLWMQNIGNIFCWLVILFLILTNNNFCWVIIITAERYDTWW